MPSVYPREWQKYTLLLSLWGKNQRQRRAAFHRRLPSQMRWPSSALWSPAHVLFGSNCWEANSLKSFSRQGAWKQDQRLECVAREPLWCLDAEESFFRDIWNIRQLKIHGCQRAAKTFFFSEAAAAYTGNQNTVERTSKYIHSHWL